LHFLAFYVIIDRLHVLLVVHFVLEVIKLSKHKDYYEVCKQKKFTRARYESQGLIIKETQAKIKKLYYKEHRVQKATLGLFYSVWKKIDKSSVVYVSYNCLIAKKRGEIKELVDEISDENQIATDLYHRSDSEYFDKNDLDEAKRLNDLATEHRHNRSELNQKLRKEYENLFDLMAEALSSVDQNMAANMRENVKLLQAIEQDIVKNCKKNHNDRQELRRRKAEFNRTSMLEREIGAELRELKSSKATPEVKLATI
jgi:hypothetical protein